MSLLLAKHILLDSSSLEEALDGSLQVKVDNSTVGELSTYTVDNKIQDDFAGLDNTCMGVKNGSD